MKSATSSAEFTGDTILNELYINPYLYSVEQFLRAEEAGESGVSIESTSSSVLSLTMRGLSIPPQKLQRTNQMALTNISLREAEYLYPHLFLHI